MHWGRYGRGHVPGTALTGPVVVRPQTGADDPFTQLVFSGGGLRCYWQGGFLSAATCLPLQPRRIIGVSGGALSAVVHVARAEQDLLAAVCAMTARQQRNFDILRRHGAFMPHQRLYQQLLEQVLTPELCARVAAGSELLILIGHPPSDRFPTLTGAAMTVVYEAERRVKGLPHFDWPEKLGVEWTLVDARQAARDGSLADLVGLAAIIPPVFRPGWWNGRRVIDGGMADQAPVPDIDGQTLVLLTRRYPGLRPTAGRTYIGPGQEVPIKKIDFTSPDKIKATWQHGERDGETLCQGRGG